MNHGNLTNHLLANATTAKAPAVGDGATEILWSDRHAYTVVEIVSAREIVVQRDNAIRTDENGMSDLQRYDYERNPNGEKVTLIRRVTNRFPDGVWLAKGGSIKDGRRFSIGNRREYYDYSF